MPRGQPDWGSYQQKAVGATLADMADLAVRLGSIVEYDRRGDIIFLDDFEGVALDWATPGFPANAITIFNSVYPFMGSQCLRLTTTNVALSYTGIVRSLGSLGSNRVGLEISFSSVGANIDLILEIRFRAGGAIKTAGIRIAPADLMASYLIGIGIWADLQVLPALPNVDGYYSTVKFVVDFNTDRFVRLLVNSTEWDISAFPVIVLGGGVVDDIRITIQTLNRAAIGEDAYLDNFILTQSEP